LRLFSGRNSDFTRGAVPAVRRYSGKNDDDSIWLRRILSKFDQQRV